MPTSALTRVAHHQLELLDALGRAVLIATADGAVYQTVGLERCLARERPGGRQRLERAIIALADWMAHRGRRRGPARAAARPLAASRQVRTVRSRYRLHAVLLGPNVLHAEGGAVVIDVERAARAPLSGKELRARFGLTLREAEVVELMARGLTDAAIATELGISRRTAEHHAEHVRRKLGLSARAAVSAAVFAAGDRFGPLARASTKLNSGRASGSRHPARRPPGSRRSHGARAVSRQARPTQRRSPRPDHPPRL